MTYKIDEKNYRIEIKGDSKYIKDWFYAITDEIPDSMSVIRNDFDEISELEKMTSAKKYTFPMNERIYLDKTSILYSANKLGEGGEMIFKAIVLPRFENARKKLGK